MSLRTIVSIAASVVTGIAYAGTFSADAAGAPAGTKRINPHHVHHGSKIHHSGQAHRNMPATSTAGTTTGIGTGNSGQAHRDMSATSPAGTTTGIGRGKSY